MQGVVLGLVRVEPSAAECRTERGRVDADDGAEAGWFVLAEHDLFVAGIAGEYAHVSLLVSPSRDTLWGARAGWPGGVCRIIFELTVRPCRARDRRAERAVAGSPGCQRAVPGVARSVCARQLRRVSPGVRAADGFRPGPPGLLAPVRQGGPGGRAVGWAGPAAYRGPGGAWRGLEPTARPARRTRTSWRPRTRCWCARGICGSGSPRRH